MSKQDPILITGASGFVGSAVARAARQRGFQVRALIRPSSPRQNLAGLNAEAPTLESLRDKLPAVISDLIEDNEPALRGTISWSRSSLTRRRASPPSHEGLR